MGLRIFRPSIGAMLESASSHLDQIFGAGAHRVSAQDDQSALISTIVGDFEFTDDPRDFVACAMIGFSGPGTKDPLETYLQFLGIDDDGQSRLDGWQIQLTKELDRLAIVVSNILTDNEIRRDAVSFIRGYNRAYNDWASGKWNVPAQET